MGIWKVHFGWGGKGMEQVKWRSGLTFSSSGLPRHCATASQNLRHARSTGLTGYRDARSSRCLVKSRVPDGMSRNWVVVVIRQAPHGTGSYRKKNEGRTNKASSNPTIQHKHKIDPPRHNPIGKSRKQTSNDKEKRGHTAN